MGEASETGNAEAHENEGAMDAGAAPRLLTQTQRQAQRDLDYRSPLLSLVAAVVVLVGFGFCVADGSRAASLQGTDRRVTGGPLYALIAIRIATVI